VVGIAIVAAACLIILVWLFLHYGKGTKFSVGARVWKLLEVDLKFGHDSGHQELQQLSSRTAVDAEAPGIAQQAAGDEDDDNDSSHS
jgi:hypothetical protein